MISYIVIPYNEYIFITLYLKIKDNQRNIKKKNHLSLQTF